MCDLQVLQLSNNALNGRISQDFSGYQKLHTAELQDNGEKGWHIAKCRAELWTHPALALVPTATLRVQVPAKRD